MPVSEYIRIFEQKAKDELWKLSVDEKNDIYKIPSTKVSDIIKQFEGGKTENVAEKNDKEKSYYRKKISTVTNDNNERRTEEKQIDEEKFNNQEKHINEEKQNHVKKESVKEIKANFKKNNDEEIKSIGFKNEENNSKGKEISKPETVSSLLKTFKEKSGEGKKTVTFFNKEDSIPKEESTELENEVLVDQKKNFKSLRKTFEIDETVKNVTGLKSSEEVPDEKKENFASLKKTFETKTEETDQELKNAVKLSDQREKVMLLRKNFEANPEKQEKIDDLKKGTYKKTSEEGDVMPQGLEEYIDTSTTDELASNKIFKRKIEPHRTNTKRKIVLEELIGQPTFDNIQKKDDKLQNEIRSLEMYEQSFIDFLKELLRRDSSHDMLNDFQRKINEVLNQLRVILEGSKEFLKRIKEVDDNLDLILDVFLDQGNLFGKYQENWYLQSEISLLDRANPPMFGQIGRKLSKYELFLENVEKHLLPQDPRIEKVKTTIIFVQGFARTINDITILPKIVKIEFKIKDYLPILNHCNVECSSSIYNDFNCQLYLFNKIILLTEVKKNGYHEFVVKKTLSKIVLTKKKKKIYLTCSDNKEKYVFKAENELVVDQFMKKWEEAVAR